MKTKDTGKSDKKKAVKIQRLLPFKDEDLCACGPINAFRCHGPCREIHKDEHGVVQCTAKYRIEPEVFRVKKKRFKKKREEEVKPKRDWDKKNRYKD